MLREKGFWDLPLPGEGLPPSPQASQTGTLHLSPLPDLQAGYRGKADGDAQRPVAPAAKAPSFPAPGGHRTAPPAPAAGHRSTQETPGAEAGRKAAPVTNAQHTARPRGRTGAGRPRFISPLHGPSPLGPGAARRDRSRAPLRPWRRDPPQLEPRLPPQARRQQLKAAVTAGRGGSGRSDTHAPRRSAALQAPATLPLSFSLFPPSRNQQGFQNGGFSGGEEEAGRRRPISARGPAGAGRAGEGARHARPPAVT